MFEQKRLRRQIPPPSKKPAGRNGPVKRNWLVALGSERVRLVMDSTALPD